MDPSIKQEQPKKKEIARGTTPEKYSIKRDIAKQNKELKQRQESAQRIINPDEYLEDTKGVDYLKKGMGQGGGKI